MTTQLQASQCCYIDRHVLQESESLIKLIQTHIWVLRLHVNQLMTSNPNFPAFLCFGGLFCLFSETLVSI